ncbi:hypothetical protein VTI28DRAFT_5946 [Corynascus sepedonium]
MLATIVDEVNKTLDEKQTEKHQRYEAFTQELAKATMSGSTAHHHPLDFTKLDACHKATAKDDPGDSEQRIRASPVAKCFAEIPASDYRASHDYLLSHPEVLQKESETDGLFIEAYYMMLDQNDEKRAWQYVHQALLLQYTRMLGRDGVALFFKRITTPGHLAHEVFEKDVAERFQNIRSMAKRDSKERSGGVEQVQSYPANENSSIRIQVPPTSSEDEKVKKARNVFEQFSPEMSAALESGSLDEVNGVLAEMPVSEAEEMVGLLNEIGCLSIEEYIIDATTEEGKRRLLEIEKGAIANAHPTSSTV